MLTPEREQSSIALLAKKVSLTGLLLFVLFAPHSVAASSIGIALATLGWLFHILATRSTGLRRSKIDLIILLTIVWTVASALLSTEPSLSIPKLQALWSVIILYLARAVLTKRTALLMVSVLIISASAGVLYGAYDLLRGRGVVVESIAPSSPFRQIDLPPGDTVWRIDGERVYSIEEIDTALKSAFSTPLTVSIISRGEHVERPGLTMTAEQQWLSSPSGLTGNVRNHLFRASGWTRHYETFAEILQMVAQLALGLALANLRNHGLNKYFKIALLATVVLALGIGLTAMRTVLLAFVLGASLMVWGSVRGKAKVIITAVLFLVLGFGAVVVWQTRAENALTLRDPSSSLRATVARVGLSRIMIHPVFGHGMDAMQLHWNEWGFPGKDMLHLHSTPLQLAFDRGLPMLGLWIWMMISFFLLLLRSVTKASELSDTNSFGILLGSLGALIGFLASSMVNYNYGDSEVIMMFWFVMGMSMAIGDSWDKRPRGREV